MQESHPTYRDADAALRAAGYRYDFLGGMWRGHRGRTATITRMHVSVANATGAAPPAYVVTYSPSLELVAASCSASSTSSDAQP